MLDILIKNGAVVDGTGRSIFRADVGVAGDRVVSVAESIDQEAARTIDARGLHVAPGFVDPHTHSDRPLLVDPTAQSKIRQGVTTEVIGNCGYSPAPATGAAVEEVGARAREMGIEVTWQSFGEYLDRMRDPGIALNVVPLVGHNTVRGAVIGYDAIQPTPEQQAEMERVVEEAMEQGARGLSTGLFYPPGYYARSEEVIGLAQAAGRHGGVYASHIRSESDTVLQAVAEATETAEQANVQTEIAHLKLEGYRNWGEIDSLEALLDDAQARGLRIGCDQYPYIASNTWLGGLLPYEYQAGGAKAVAKRLRDPAFRREMRRDWDEKRADWENRGGQRDWSGVQISVCPDCTEVLGKTIAQIAEERGQDPLEVVFDLIVVSEGLGSAVWFTQDEENVRRLMRHPLVVIGSDGSSLNPEGVLGARRVHPRNYGTFPRILGRYVREEKVLSLEEAVKKMTSISAERFGLADRGVVREGAFADLVLFDAERVTDRATFADPHEYPEGIPYVLVNGSIVLDQGQHSGALPGQVL
jgi:N-acyl-D-amino-acid deacylase